MFIFPSFSHFFFKKKWEGWKKYYMRLNEMIQEKKQIIVSKKEQYQSSKKSLSNKLNIYSSWAHPPVVNR